MSDYARPLTDLDANLKLLKSALPNKDYTEAQVAISIMLQDLYVLKDVLNKLDSTASIKMVYAHLV